jgi:hypothetical protein
VAEAHQSARHKAALRLLRGRAAVQYCFTCGKELLADARMPDPRTITLGHYVDMDAHLVPDPYDPSAYGPQCGPCNSRGGAQRTNAKRRGDPIDEVIASPHWG